MTYTYQSDFTHVYDKFEYYSEDMNDCNICVNFKSRSIAKLFNGNGCGQPMCEFQDLKDEAVRHNRLKRPRGWNKPCQTE